MNGHFIALENGELVTFFGHRQLGLDEDDGLLSKFLTESAELAFHAIDFVGRSLYYDENKLSPEIVAFHRTLGVVLASCSAKNRSKSKTESPPIRFLVLVWGVPELWAFSQLESFVAVVRRPEPDHEIMEKLERAPQRIACQRQYVS